MKAAMTGLAIGTTALGLLALSTVAAQAGTVDVVAELDRRPGNPAIGPSGEIYLSMHPFGAPEHRVVRLEDDGSLTPFPNAQWSSSFVNVIGITMAADGVLWMLDMGSDAQSVKLVGWDIATDALHAVHYLPIEATGRNPFFQDLAVDAVGRRAYIADMSRGDMSGISEPAIVVVDLGTGETRRLLEGHDLFQPDRDVVQVADGNAMTVTGSDGVTQPAALGLNPIAIDEDADTLYFSTIAPGPIHTVPTRIIGDFDATDSDIIDAIEVVGTKPTSDGMAVSGDTVFMTNVETGAIDAYTDGAVRTVSDDDRLIWPDGIAVDSDGSLIVTVNQLHRAPPFNGGVPGGQPPYLVVRITEE